MVQWWQDSGHCSTVLGSIENCESKDYRNVLESKGWSRGRNLNKMRGMYWMVQLQWWHCE